LQISGAIQSFVLYGVILLNKWIAI